MTFASVLMVCLVPSEGLASNERLSHVYLMDNRIGNRGAEALAVALDHHPGLVVLGLQHNLVEQRGRDRLNKTLRDNSLFKSLHMRGNLP